MRLLLLAGATAAALVVAAEAPAIRFIDIAAQSGLTVPNTFGGRESKQSILESTGTGVAIFDFNGDGANDVFIANGPPSRSQLYRNDGSGHFTEVGAQAGSRGQAGRKRPASATSTTMATPICSSLTTATTASIAIWAAASSRTSPRAPACP